MDIISRLGAKKVIGRDIRVFKETTSTNDVVEKLARLTGFRPATPLLEIIQRTAAAN